jgi:hypothetical protein
VGPYCRFCGRRCFVYRVLADGRGMLLATCAEGMDWDRQQCGQAHTTATNPIPRGGQTADAILRAMATATKPDLPE